jgi:hypothetical protein
VGSAFSAAAPRSSSNNLAAEEAKLQAELQGCDRKLELLRSGTGSLLPPVPRPPAAAARDRLGEASIVKGVIAATGQGCKEVLDRSAGAGSARGAPWKTRPRRGAAAESSCVLQLRAPRHADLVVRVTFADPASVPAAVRFEHAAAHAAPFAAVGEVRLHAKSMQQLKHVFRLGPASAVDRCLRLTFLGHIARQHSGVHQVSHLLVSGQRVAAGGPSGGAASSDGVALFAVHGGGSSDGLLETATSAPAEVEVDVAASMAGGRSAAMGGAPPAPWTHGGPTPPPLPWSQAHGGPRSSSRGLPDSADLAGLEAAFARVHLPSTVRGGSSLLGNC